MEGPGLESRSLNPKTWVLLHVTTISPEITKTRSFRYHLMSLRVCSHDSSTVRERSSKTDALSFFIHLIDEESEPWREKLAQEHPGVGCYSASEIQALSAVNIGCCPKDMSYSFWILSEAAVLVHSCCHNKHRTGWFKQQKLTFSQFLRLEV